MPPKEPIASEAFQTAKLERYRAETEEIVVENENARDRSAAEIRDQDERRAATIARDAEREKAEIAGKETSREDTRLERRVFIGVTVLGFILAAFLALRFAGQSNLRYHLGPAAGLLISAGGGLRLRIITSKKAAPDVRTPEDPESEPA